ncbi:MAG TPA: sigma factor, partial [Burkholderiaceae bacterium]|nr:sigma factor [Burkholderiaceae bacterium]
MPVEPRCIRCFPQKVQPQSTARTCGTAFLPTARKIATPLEPFSGSAVFTAKLFCALPAKTMTDPASAIRWSAHEARDADWLRRIAGGDRAAFEALYKAYFTRLGRFLQRMLQRPSLIEEVINDTMYIVWSRARQYTGESKASTWIFG